MDMHVDVSMYIIIIHVHVQSGAFVTKPMEYMFIYYVHVYRSVRYVYIHQQSVSLWYDQLFRFGWYVWGSLMRELKS